MSTEIERKWIVDEGVEQAAQAQNASRNHLANQGEDPSLIDQWYVITENGSELRLRQRTYEETVFEMGIKRGQGKIREEHTIKVTEAQARKLIGASHSHLRKIRQEMMWDSLLIIELDVYLQDLQGLVVAEIEFPNGNDENFEKPDWFGKEVTSDERFKNKWLAKNGIPSLQA
jgi:CYTH domain-containing protein